MVSGKSLAEQYGLDARQSLYRETGNWYHVPTNFPALLFDKDGYVKFSSPSEFDRFIEEGKLAGVSCSKEKNWLTVRGGIKTLAQYKVLFAVTSFPDEIEEGTFLEGAGQQVLVNRFERDRKARAKCVQHWGVKCSVCEFDFETQFGELGVGFIHVHHITPLSSIGSEYRINPKKDLRPVCPNCHAMLHRRSPPILPEDLRRMMFGAKKSKPEPS